MYLRTAFLVTILLVSGAFAPVLAQELTAEDVERLESAASPYKVTPEMEGRIRDLLAPFDLDAELPGGYVLEGITIDRHSVKLLALSPDHQFVVHLLPPVVEARATLATPSFKIIVPPGANQETVAAITGAIVKNDNGTFWPETPAFETSEGRKIPPSVKKVHFTELMGDLFVVLLAVAAFLALSAFRQYFGSRPMAWWWLLLGCGVVAVAVRTTVYLLGLGVEHSGVWTPSAELPHVSTAWYLNMVSRFSLVTLKTVTVVNILFGVGTVVGVFVVASIFFEGLLAPLVAGLFVATLPAHAALSCSITTMIPLVFFLVWLLVGKALFSVTGNIRAHLFAAACTLFAVFARPEALVLVLPAVIYPFLAMKRAEWLKAGFLVPLALETTVIAVRIATLHLAPDYPDRFLSLELDVRALFNNLGVWVFSFGRMPFVAMLLWAVGIAARPWRTNLGASLVLGAWFLLAIAVYFHVDLSETFQGGRVSLVLVPVLALLAAQGGAALSAMKHKQRRWAIALVIVWLLLVPLIHSRALMQDYKAVYDTNYLVEA